MNQAQIIQMAREAGFFVDGSIIRNEEGYNDQTETVERFAAAIRASTKEEDAKIYESVCEKIDGKLPGWIEIAADAIRASK